MAVEFLKTSTGLPPDPRGDTADIVRLMLARLKAEGETAARDYARRLDRWDGEIVVPPQRIAAAAARLPEELREAIACALANIRRFAAAQRATAQEMEIELRPGLVAGQKQIPVTTAGAYVPGGRYAHVASALMTIATARAAGVRNVIACAPPHDAAGIHPAVLHAMAQAGADRILCLGGVQGVAALAFGLFGGPPADILVGPGNPFVTEAKRQLFGPVGIDLFAGPTDLMILADATADPRTVAWDLAAQAEHGANSPVWLVTDDRALAEAVLRLVPRCIAELPEPNRGRAGAAWAALGEVMLCADREEMAATADARAPEHLHVQAADPDWWRGRLRAYGALFLGPESTVAFGDKAAGPNHVLPTAGAARHTGGLSVHSFLRTVTWMRATGPALPELARATATISRAEGMEGHARSAEIRLAKPPAGGKITAQRKDAP